MTKKQLQELVNIGGGFGFFGHEVRNAKHWSKVTKNTDSVSTLVDKAFLKAVKNLELTKFEAFAYGDSRVARHDADNFSDYIYTSLQRKTGLKKIESELTLKFTSMINSFFAHIKNEEIIELATYWKSRS